MENAVLNFVYIFYIFSPFIGFGLMIFTINRAIGFVRDYPDRFHYAGLSFWLSLISPFLVGINAYSELGYYRNPVHEFLDWLYGLHYMLVSFLFLMQFFLVVCSPCIAFIFGLRAWKISGFKNRTLGAIGIGLSILVFLFAVACFVYAWFINPRCLHPMGMD